MICSFFLSFIGRAKTANLHNARNKSLWQHLSKEKLSTLTFSAMAIKYAIRFERHRSQVEKLCNWKQESCKIKVLCRSGTERKRKMQEKGKQKRTKCNKSQINIKKWKVPLRNDKNFKRENWKTGKVSCTWAIKKATSKVLSLWFHFKSSNKPQCCIAKEIALHCFGSVTNILIVASIWCCTPCVCLYLMGNLLCANNEKARKKNGNDYKTHQEREIIHFCLLLQTHSTNVLRSYYAK